jgi:hypothetical protein
VVVVFAGALLLAGFQSRIPSSVWPQASPAFSNADEGPLRLPLPEDRQVVAIFHSIEPASFTRPPDAVLPRETRSGFRLATERHGARHGLRAPPAVSL